MAGFDNPWYAEMIERFRVETKNDGADGIALAILAGFSILATAVDGLTGAVGRVANALEDCNPAT